MAKPSRIEGLEADLFALAHEVEALDERLHRIETVVVTLKDQISGGERNEQN